MSAMYFLNGKSTRITFHRAVGGDLGQNSLGMPGIYHRDVGCALGAKICTAKGQRRQKDYYRYVQTFSDIRIY